MKVLKVFSKVFAIFFSVIFFFILTAFMAASFSLNLFSEKYYSNVLKNIDFKDIKVSDLGYIFESAPVSKDATLEDVAIVYITEGGISKELATSVVNNEKIKAVAGRFIASYVNYNITGKTPVIEKKDIEEIFNEPDIIKLLNESNMRDKVDIDKIYNQLTVFAHDMTENGGAKNGNFKRIENNNIINY